MENLNVGEVRDVFDKNNNKIMSYGVVEAPKEEFKKYAELNSWIEGFCSDIISLEDEIRKYCISNNIEIIHLYSKKAGWFRKTCYFYLKGEFFKMLKLKRNLDSLVY
jgi:hypothetical protein